MVVSLIFNNAWPDPMSNISSLLNLCSNFYHCSSFWNYFLWALSLTLTRLSSMLCHHADLSLLPLSSLNFSLAWSLLWLAQARFCSIFYECIAQCVCVCVCKSIVVCMSVWIGIWVLQLNVCDHVTLREGYYQMTYHAVAVIVRIMILN